MIIVASWWTFLHIYLSVYFLIYLLSMFSSLYVALCVSLNHTIMLCAIIPYSDVNYVQSWTLPIDVL